MGWAWQFVVAVLGETTAASGSGRSVRPKEGEVHMQGRKITSLIQYCVFVD